MASARWNCRPEGSNWGDFGPDDQLGRLNLLTPERISRALDEVVENRTFCLSLPLDYPGGMVLSATRKPPQLTPTLHDNGRPMFNLPMRELQPGATDIVSDDGVTLSLQYSTHWDCLAHVGQYFDVEGDGNEVAVYYNGFRAGTDIVGGENTGEHVGARRLDAAAMAGACIQGRGVMVDIEAHFGREGRLIGYDELMAVIERDEIEIEEGDLVCLRTGFAQLLLEMNKQPDRERLFGITSALDGRDERLHRWITESGLAALIADNYAVERLPARHAGTTSCACLPLHAHCIFKLGVHLGEMWHLSELADWLRTKGRSRFLLTAPPLRLPGAVGSPTTPIATV